MSDVGCRVSRVCAAAASANRGPVALTCNIRACQRPDEEVSRDHRQANALAPDFADIVTCHRDEAKRQERPAEQQHLLPRAFVPLSTRLSACRVGHARRAAAWLAVSCAGLRIWRRSQFRRLPPQRLCRACWPGFRSAASPSSPGNRNPRPLFGVTAGAPDQGPVRVNHHVDDGNPIRRQNRCGFPLRERERVCVWTACTPSGARRGAGGPLSRLLRTPKRRRNPGGRAAALPIPGLKGPRRPASDPLCAGCHGRSSHTQASSRGAVRPHRPQ